MSKVEKPIKRLKSCPKDFTYQELVKLLTFLGYGQIDKGKTAGSRVGFYNEKTDSLILLHKPHPGNQLSVAAVKSVYQRLKDKGEI